MKLQELKQVIDRPISIEEITHSFKCDFTPLEKVQLIEHTANRF